MRFSNFLLGVGWTISTLSVQAATTNISANIVDPSCEVTIPTGIISFDSKMIYQFPQAGAAVQLLPLNVELDCENVSSLNPYLKVTGESIGLLDTRLFRAASSDATGVGFMLKEGALTDVASFYNAEGTVSPNSTITLSQDGISVQPFTVGLVRGAGETSLGGGDINAKITFTFAYP